MEENQVEEKEVEEKIALTAVEEAEEHHDALAIAVFVVWC